uniref:ADF-H domain-containing protein n=1 Tax=Steinernema glaseri TaxID=37863 RepID=A0A1I7ZU15_9BILA
MIFRAKTHLVLLQKLEARNPVGFLIVRIYGEKRGATCISDLEYSSLDIMNKLNPEQFETTKINVVHGLFEVSNSFDRIGVVLYFLFKTNDKEDATVFTMITASITNFYSQEYTTQLTKSLNHQPLGTPSSYFCNLSKTTEP